MVDPRKSLGFAGVSDFEQVTTQRAIQMLLRAYSLIPTTSATSKTCTSTGFFNMPCSLSTVANFLYGVVVGAIRCWLACS